MMEHPQKKVGKISTTFAVICLLALPLVALSALSYEEKATNGEVLETGPQEFDHNGRALFKSYYQLTVDYLLGTSTERTLAEYYSRREYPGAPPFIPHKVKEVNSQKVNCLACHAKGGWAEEFKRHTPLTPHPELVSCRQCHVEIQTDELFVANKWMSLPPPRLGRSHLPGAPPPVPHDLQMRNNCISCHVGPGAVVALRIDHFSRGDCRQCHVPENLTNPFRRRSGLQ